MSNSKPGMKRMEDSCKTDVDILCVYMSYLYIAVMWWTCTIVHLGWKVWRKITPLLGHTNSISCFTDYFIAYGRIALTLELLGRFGRFLDEDDRHSPPVLLVPFSRLLGL